MSRALAYFGIAVSITVASGWAFRLPLLTTILPGEAPMVALTALAVLILSVSLLLSAQPEGREVDRSVGRWLAVVAVAVAAGGGIQYASPHGFRLDDWLQRLVSGPLGPDNGMSLATVACVLGAAAGIILGDARGRTFTRLGVATAAFAFVAAAVGGLGYVYGVGALHQGGPFSRMSLLSALALGLLSAGVLLSRPHGPWVATVLRGGEVARVLLPAVVVAPLLLGALEIYAVRSNLLEPETGTALLVTVLAICLAALALRLARDVERRIVGERRLRDALQAMNEALERRVEERTRDLAQAQDALIQAQKMEAIGQLTGGVAHDFNNLLTIIRSSVEFLRRPNLPEERRVRYMDAVSDTVDRAAKLTGQLLAFARRQPLRPETFDVGSRLVGLATMLDTLTGARIRVVTTKPECPCFVHADASQFDTAIVNLAVNARDAMDGEGTLTLTLSCGREKPAIRGHAGLSTPFVTLGVGDTGAGIAAENVARIFEPFFTTKEVGKGTGLGLSQVIGFAKQSGGDVDVASVVGHGTTFTLYLPQGQEAVMDVAEDAVHDDAQADDEARCILVVEDNVEIGRFCTQILHDLGYGAILTETAEAALAEIEAVPSRYDAVFSDVVMPGMGGFELAKRLRETHPGLPVVLTSGYSHVLAQDDAHGFDLVRKPYSAAQVDGALRSATRRRRRARALGIHAGDELMTTSKPRLVGLNHVALEVGDIGESLGFYRAVFSFELRGTHEDEAGRTVMAFLDMGDQFLVLSAGREQPADTERHFGLVVDDRTGVMELAEKAGAKVLDRPFNFLDPWGNRLEIVAYPDVQFTKAGEILGGMGLNLGKGDEALGELRRKLSSPPARAED
ncbi:ATP-binding protein [Methylobacterium tardum]|uniref:ATP-binding protein n=1 Tax=Methylobacterium tardum TaxID=374432 RepID=UPI0036140415